MMNADRSSSERSENGEDMNEALSPFERTAIFGRPVSKDGMADSEYSFSVEEPSRDEPQTSTETVTCGLDATYHVVASVLLLVYGMVMSVILGTHRRLLSLYRRLRGIEEEVEEEEPGISVEDAEKERKRLTRLHHICTELLDTEEAYVERLGLLCQAKEKAAKALNADIAKDMFKDVEVIHQFHRENFLPQLRDRMAQWSEKNHVGDIMKNLAPFLKLYTEYVKDFQKCSGLVDRYEKQSAAFSASLKEIRETQGPRHGRLTIQAHMMEPIQRVPRYELLLRDYIKRIPDDSTDKEDAEKALKCVSEAATHFENMMKRDSRICTLMGVQARLDGNVNVVDLTDRELIKEGRIQRVMPSGGHSRLSNKYIFLFSDILLICSRQKLIVGKYKVRAVLYLAELENIFGSRNLEFPFTFYLKCIEEDFELCGYTQDESRQWIEVLTQKLCKIRNMETSITGLPDLTSMSQDDSSIVTKDYLQLSDDEGKTWKKRWFSLHNSGTLFTFKTQQDCQFCGSLNTRDFIKSTIDGMPKKNHVIELQWEVRNDAKYLFYHDNSEELDKWMEHMKNVEDINKKKV